MYGSGVRGVLQKLHLRLLCCWLLQQLQLCCCHCGVTQVVQHLQSVNYSDVTLQLSTPNLPQCSGCGEGAATPCWPDCSSYPSATCTSHVTLGQIGWWTMMNRGQQLGSESRQITELGVSFSIITPCRWTLTTR